MNFTVRGDPARLHDALRNLVANAITYGPPATTVRVEARRIGRRITISVLDQGPGIPEEDLTRVFERFYRVDKARSRELGGTGLGLSIVKHLAHAFGGRVAVTSVPGEGSTFTVELPVG